MPLLIKSELKKVKFKHIENKKIEWTHLHFYPEISDSLAKVSYFNDQWSYSN